MSKFKIAFLLIFCLLGGLTSLTGIIAIWKGSASTDWPHVEGWVLAAETSYAGGSVQTRPTHKVKYSYTVNGQYFTGERIAFQFDRGNVSKNGMFYAAGHQVSVFYNPVEPSDSVLLNGIQPYYLFITGLGIAFIAFGCFGQRYIPRRKSNDS